MRVILVGAAPWLAHLDVRVISMARGARTEVAAAALAERAMIVAIRWIAKSLAHLAAHIAFNARVARGSRG